MLISTVQQSDSVLYTHTHTMGSPGCSAGKESACNVGDLGSIPGLGWSPGEGNGYPLRYSGLENSMGSQRIRHDWETCTVLHTYTHTHIHIFFSIFFSIMVYHRILNIVPCCLSIIMHCKINYRRMGIFMMLNLSKQVHGTFLFRFTSVTSKNLLISLSRYCMFFLLSLLLNALSVLFL